MKFRFVTRAHLVAVVLLLFVAVGLTVESISRYRVEALLSAPQDLLISRPGARFVRVKAAAFDPSTEVEWQRFLRESEDSIFVVVQNQPVETVFFASANREGKIIMSAIRATPRFPFASVQVRPELVRLEYFKTNQGLVLPVALGSLAVIAWVAFGVLVWFGCKFS